MPFNSVTQFDFAAEARRALLARGQAVPAGRTWGEFKRAMALLGVEDSTVIGSIEYGVSSPGTNYLTCERADDDSLDIKEMR